MVSRKRAGGVGWPVGCLPFLFGKAAVARLDSEIVGLYLNLQRGWLDELAARTDQKVG